MALKSCNIELPSFSTNAACVCAREHISQGRTTRMLESSPQTVGPVGRKACDRVDVQFPRELSAERVLETNQHYVRRLYAREQETISLVSLLLY